MIQNAHQRMEAKIARYYREFIRMLDRSTGTIPRGPWKAAVVSFGSWNGRPCYILKRASGATAKVLRNRED